MTRIAIYFLMSIFLCSIGCFGKGKSEQHDVATNLPDSDDVLTSSICLADPINPRLNENSNWELSLDERSDLLSVFRRATRVLAPDETMKWEGSGFLTFETVDNEFWIIGLFLVGDKLIFKVKYPDGKKNYYESHTSADSFREKLKLLFD